MEVFIAGAPRSGTSVLVFALKDVFGLPGDGESHVIPAFQGMVHHLRSYMQRFDNNHDPITLKKLNRLAAEENLFEFIRKFYSETYPGGSWVDKTPTDEAVFGLPLIETIFPNARLIVTKRNGVEVVLSFIRKFNANFEDACITWRNSMEGLTHSRATCRNLLELDQYDYLNAPSGVGMQIARHLGASDRAEDIARYLLRHRIETTSTHDPKVRLRLADTDWSDAQKEIFRRQCGPLMEAFGYDM